MGLILQESQCFSFTKVASALAVALSTNKLKEYSDAFISLENQLKQVTSGTENLTAVTDALFQVALKKLGAK